MVKPWTAPFRKISRRFLPKGWPNAWHGSTATRASFDVEILWAVFRALETGTGARASPMRWAQRQMKTAPRNR